MKALSKRSPSKPRKVESRSAGTMCLWNAIWTAALQGGGTQDEIVARVAGRAGRVNEVDQETIAEEFEKMVLRGELAARGKRYAARKPWELAKKHAK